MNSGHELDKRDKDVAALMKQGVSASPFYFLKFYYLLLQYSIPQNNFPDQLQ